MSVQILHGQKDTKRAYTYVRNFQIFKHRQSTRQPWIQRLASQHLNRVNISGKPTNYPVVFTAKRLHLMKHNEMQGDLWVHHFLLVDVLDNKFIVNDRVISICYESKHVVQTQNVRKQNLGFQDTNKIALKPCKLRCVQEVLFINTERVAVQRN